MKKILIFAFCFLLILTSCESKKLSHNKSTTDELIHENEAANITPFIIVNEENAKGFAIEGKVFEDTESGSFIVCGARFQHHVTLHIAMMGGDYEKCLDFAVNYAKAQGLSKVSCTYAIENEKLEEALKARGFVAEASDLITMEIVF